MRQETEEIIKIVKDQYMPEPDKFGFITMSVGYLDLMLIMCEIESHYRGVNNDSLR